MARRRRLARASGGGGTRRRPLAPVSAAAFAVLLCLLLLACVCCCLAATKPEPAAARTTAPGGMRMNVKYSPEEVSRWMERMTNDPDSPFRPATDQENAFFNRMSGAASSSSSSNGKKKTRGGGGGGLGRSSGILPPGIDGHIEFSDHYPFARIVVDGFHSAGDTSSSSSSHAEYYDVKDL